MIENWGNQNNIATQILRVGHVYGPGEEAYQKIIPVTIKNIIEGKSIEIWGTGQELRSFIYIKDVVTAIVNAIDLPNPVGVINLVGSKPISVIELVHLICKIASVNTNIQKKVVTKESRNLIFDASKMKKYLLEIETTLEEGLIEEFNYMKQLNIYNNH
jgi:nucleoside-diphosphate-sugar epimerase